MLWQPSIVRWKAEMYSISDQQENLIMLLLSARGGTPKLRNGDFVGLIAGDCVGLCPRCKKQTPEAEVLYSGSAGKLDCPVPQQPHLKAKV